MRIRTQIILTTILFGAILVVIATLVILTNDKVKWLARQEETVHTIEMNAHEMCHTTSDYLLYNEDQQLLKWESESAALSGAIESLSPFEPGQSRLVHSIRESQKRLYSIYGSIKAHSMENDQAPGADLAFIRDSWSMVAAQGQAIVSDSLSLSRMLQAEEDKSILKTNFLIFALLGVFGAYLVSTHTTIYLRILRAIARLHSGTEVIGSGNLDFAIRVARNDEIGDLSRAFNRMTANLKAVTASKTELEREICERKKIEQKLAWLATFPERDPHPIIEIDFTGKIEYKNLSAQRLFENQELNESLWVEGLDHYVEELRKKGELVATRELTVCERTWQQTIQLIEHARALRIYGTDISCRKEMEEKLQQAYKELEEANSRLEEDAKVAQGLNEELATTNKYKSEFLANMSHELRTPLNSILLLARILAANEDGNLTGKQAEAASVIYESGNDLLNLINEILDLSRIEAGKLEICMEKVSVKSLTESINSVFSHHAAEKGLEFNVVLEDDVPGEITTDRKRIEQILRNLISNAMKFTEKGGIVIRFGLASQEAGGGTQGRSLAIAVRDTGIGIPSEKKGIIFEAFQQLEAGASRRFGGTGLGLSISRELVSLLGGRIYLESRLGEGSTFTIILPVEKTSQNESGSSQALNVLLTPIADIVKNGSTPESLPPPDDRDNLEGCKKIILIIADDARFSGSLNDLAHEGGFKTLLSKPGEEWLELARRYLPAAIVLIAAMPGTNACNILEIIKDNSGIRHIPVYMISAREDAAEASQRGAMGHLAAPASGEELAGALKRIEDYLGRAGKELLIIETDESRRKSLADFLGSSNLTIDGAGTGREAISMTGQKRYDCIVLDISLPDMTFSELMRDLAHSGKAAPTPILLISERDLTEEEENEIQRLSGLMIIKKIRSEERLLDETSLFLHSDVEKLPESQRSIITRFHDFDMLFKGKKVLVVDDDMRNAFVLSKLLELRGIDILKAEDGRKALQILGEQPDVDLVLMDIMMPIMDGYETMKRIRQKAIFEKLPVIALTAKAMKEDRDRCIEAGASDYITKPVDMRRLYSMMRNWLYR